MKIRIASAAALGLLLHISASPAETPTVDSIVNKVVKAMGGKTALEKIKTRTCKGKLEIPAFGVSSDWELSSKAPNKQFSKWEISGSGTITEGFDGAVAWTKSPLEGLRIKQGDELAKVKRDVEFYRELKLKALYPDLAYKGTETVDGEQVQVLESKPSNSSREKFCISAKTGLLVRQDSEFEGAQGKVKVIARMSDFRAIDGVQYPHLLKCDLEMNEQKFEFTIKLAEVKHNVAVEDAVFAKPGS